MSPLMNQKFIKCHFIKYLGLTDLDGEGQFVWSSDGSVTNYTNWDSGEPSDGNEHCVALSSSKGYRWNDVWCNGHHGQSCYPLCQKYP